MIDSIVDKINYRFIQNKDSFNFFINHKANARHTLKTGMYTDAYHFNFTDSIYNQDGNNRFKTRIDHQGVDVLLQPFAQWQFKPLATLSLTAGLRGQYFTLSNSFAIEPRAGIDWQFAEKQSLSFGFGMHSQIQPTYIYFQRQYGANGSYRLPNEDLGFTRSNHYVLGYDLSLGRNLRLKAETYFQKLYDLPVEKEPSSYSIINEGNTFARFFPDELVNEGTGRNYGLELTLEKFFSNSFFYMFTGSLYDATYVASNGKRYNSDFNGNYMLNLLGTKEFKWGEKNKHTFGVGGKVTWGGGQRYTPVDTAASEAAGEVVGIDSLRNSKQFKDYFRADIKLNYAICRRQPKGAQGEPARLPADLLLQGGFLMLVSL
ncbi:MAG: hypothetical protein BRD50_02640 [Bacteroidetes bacterium SW_11_45_7]|nr:MAG: hypothetical protein BRD50_02640 [Bacteroidetes bacterium SW_11_45_7]